MFIRSFLPFLAATSAIAAAVVIPRPGDDELPPHRPLPHVEELTLDPPESCLPERRGQLDCYAPKLAPASRVYRYECGDSDEARMLVVDVCGIDKTCAVDGDGRASCVPTVSE